MVHLAINRDTKHSPTLSFSLSLSLQLALTGAPASSNIYVFTDAIAKDIELKETIVALIRSTKSTVSTSSNTSCFRRKHFLQFRIVFIRPHSSKMQQNAQFLLDK